MPSRRLLAPLISLSALTSLLACSDQTTAPSLAPTGVHRTTAARADAGATFFATNADYLTRIDAAAPEATFIGSTGYLPLEALAADASGTLYATHADPRHAPSLIRIDPATGLATDVGPTERGIVALGFSPEGILYGASHYGDLYTLDTGSGAATRMSGLGFTGSTMDLAFDAKGVLFVAIFDPGRPDLIMGHIRGLGDMLVRIDDLQRPTYTTTLYSGQNVGVTGIEFDSDGTLWGVSCAGMVTIDPETGLHGSPEQFPNGGLCHSDLTAAPAGAQTLSVEIDIKPGSSENPINRKSRGSVPVAILGSAEFDISSINAATLEFAGAGALAKRGGVEDVNGDGYPDRLFHFATQELALPEGTTEACVTGETSDAVAIEGCDSVSLLH